MLTATSLKQEWPQDTCTPRILQNSSTWLLALSKENPTVNVISDTSHSTNIACRQGTGRMLRHTETSIASVTVPYLQKKSCQTAPSISGLYQHSVIILKYIPKRMAIHSVFNIQKISSWKICEWVIKQNRKLVFPFPASFPSSSYFFANSYSISHMKSTNVSIFTLSQY